MSIQMVAWALETPCGSVSRKAVLLSLANCHNHHSGLCCPSLKRIANETELHRATVVRALADLESMGLIERTQRHRENGSKTSNEYVFPHAERPPMSHGATTPSRTVTPLEPEVRTGSEPTSAAKPRKRNPIWDALTAEFGEATARTEQTHRGKVVKSLAEAGATPEDVRVRAARWPRMFPNAKLTEAALERHWGLLAPPKPPPFRPRPTEKVLTPDERAASVAAAQEGLRQLKGARS